MPARQDYEMWVRISKFCKIIRVDEYLFYHYIHDGEQISKSTEKYLIGQIKIFKKYKEDYNKYRIIKFAKCFEIANLCREQNGYFMKAIYYFLLCFAISPWKFIKKVFNFIINKTIKRNNNIIDV